MLQENTYKVKWILVPRDTTRHGLYGTTTHHGSTPAVAAIASAETILNALPDAPVPCDLQVLGVFSGREDRNLLNDEELQAAVRYHPKALPCGIACRPLC
jgi:hypothetical protein